MFVLFASIFIRPGGVDNFIACFETIIVMEKKLLEFLPNPKCWKGAKVIRAVEKRTVMIQLIYIHCFYTAPFLAFLIGCTKSNPMYTMIRAVYNFELHHGPVVNLVLRIVCGFVVGLGGMIMFSTIGICYLLCAYCINCLNVWTLFLEPIEGKNGEMRLRGGLFFQNAVKMYNSLKIMAIVESKMLRDDSTLYTSYCCCIFLNVSVIIISITTITEVYAVCFVAEGAIGSKIWSVVLPMNIFWNKGGPRRTYIFPELDTEQSFSTRLAKLTPARKAVVVLQRSTFHLAYCFEFDETTGCIKAVKNWRYKAFQLIWIGAAFLVLPGLLVRCYLLFIAAEGKEDKMTIFFTAVSSGVLVIFVLFGSIFIRPGGVDNFIACFETIIVMEKKLLECLPNPKGEKGAKVTRAVERCTLMIQLVCIHSFYTAPLLAFLIGCTKSNPLYAMFRDIYNFELHHGALVNLGLRIVGGLGVGLGGMIMCSTIGTCFLLWVYCINCLNVWTLFLEPIAGNNGDMMFRGGVLFQNAVKMYNTLKIMTIVESNLLRELLMPCTHHIFAVFFSTLSFVYFFKEFSPRNPDDISIFVVILSVIIIAMTTLIEVYSICFIAEAAIKEIQCLAYLAFLNLPLPCKKCT
ncbi:hypothetical protein Fcan01_20067 [Folsomia candida]|uniref:Uncharacterized protein n=1 Tax=Folsomia candida TaxID=158441 RepID=A0A226DHS8_FOLCA|nr:hypothetical protein Fcan01_20067 [Folsomia candida]